MQTEIDYLNAEIKQLEQQVEHLLRENHRLQPKQNPLDNHPRLVQLAELVDLQRVQCVSMPDDKGFKVTLVSGVIVFGTKEQYPAFIDKYSRYLTIKG